MCLKILLVDDDTIISDLLKEYLEVENCEVTRAWDGQEALEKISRQSFDIAIIDIMMPRMNGIDALKEIRLKSRLPVIMLTAKGDDLDRILGLELGADDYVTKPCNPRELLARVKAVLRRTGEWNEASTTPPVVEVGDLKLDQKDRSVQVRNHSVDLTQTEFELLSMLMNRLDEVVSKAEISEQILDKKLSRWDRSIDVHISNLRKKLGQHVNGDDRIRTVRGAGYLYTNKDRLAIGTG